MTESQQTQSKDSKGFKKMVALNSQVNSAANFQKNSSFMNLKPEEDDFSSPINDGVSRHFKLLYLNWFKF